MRHSISIRLDKLVLLHTTSLEWAHDAAIKVFVCGAVRQNTVRLSKGDDNGSLTLTYELPPLGNQADIYLSLDLFVLCQDPDTVDFTTGRCALGWRESGSVKLALREPHIGQKMLSYEVTNRVVDSHPTAIIKGLLKLEILSNSLCMSPHGEYGFLVADETAQQLAFVNRAHYFSSSVADQWRQSLRPPSTYLQCTQQQPLPAWVYLAVQPHTESINGDHARIEHKLIERLHLVWQAFVASPISQEAIAALPWTHKAALIGRLLSFDVLDGRYLNDLSYDELSPFKIIDNDNFTRTTGGYDDCDGKSALTLSNYIVFCLLRLSTGSLLKALQDQTNVREMLPLYVRGSVILSDEPKPICHHWIILVHPSTLRPARHNPSSKNTPVFVDPTSYWPCTDEPDNPFNAPLIHDADNSLYGELFEAVRVSTTYQWITHAVLPAKLVAEGLPLQYILLQSDGTKYGITPNELNHGTFVAEPIVVKQNAICAAVDLKIGRQTEPQAVV